MLFLFITCYIKYGDSMECPKCGAKIVDERFCLRCGNPITQEKTQNADEVLEENEAHFKGEVSRFSWKIIFCFLAILLFLPVSLHIFNLISNDSNRLTFAIIYVIILVNVYSFLFIKLFRSINDVLYLHYKHTESKIIKTILFALWLGLLIIGLIVKLMN